VRLPCRLPAGPIEKPPPHHPRNVNALSIVCGCLVLLALQIQIAANVALAIFGLPIQKSKIHCSRTAAAVYGIRS